MSFQKDKSKIQVELTVQLSGAENENDTPSVGIYSENATIDELSRADTKLLTINSTATCGERLKMLCCAVKTFETKHVNNNAVLHIVIVPEAFRMWFYFGFVIFTFIAIVVSTNFSDIDYVSNPFVETWGGNNICLFYDYPPFTYFGSTLWFPQTMNALLYEVFDLYRVYDEYSEKKLSKTFWYFYATAAVYEMFSFIFFGQITATSPFENIYLHSIPFIMLIFALYTLSLKRFMYMRKSGILQKSFGGCWYYLGWAYVSLLSVCVIVKASLLVPNLFGAHIFLIPGFEWTTTFLKYVVYLWLFLTVIAPIIIYSIFTEDLKPVKLVIDRTTHN